MNQLLLNSNIFELPHGMGPKEHSKNLDKIFGFKIIKVEKKLLKKYKPFYIADEGSTKNSYQHNSEAWIGLHPQTLMTPYSEILEIFCSLSSFKTLRITDFGCAYGRIGIVASSMNPLCEFTGFEVVSERAREGRRIFNNLNLNLNQILTQNIMDHDFELPTSDVYFIYDFGHVEHIKIILKKISEKINLHEFVLVAKGDEVRSIIQLYYPIFYSRHRPIHKKGWSAYINYSEKI